MVVPSSVGSAKTGRTNIFDMAREAHIIQISIFFIHTLLSWCKANDIRSFTISYRKAIFIITDKMSHKCHKNLKRAGYKPKAVKEMIE
jgi:hypothetical protein